MKHPENCRTEIDESETHKHLLVKRRYLTSEWLRLQEFLLGETLKKQANRVLPVKHRTFLLISVR